MKTILIVESWALAIEAFTLWLQAAGAPATTIGTRRAHLRRVGRCLRGDPWTIDGADLVEWCASQDWATETRRGYRGTLRAFYRWGIEAGHLVDNPAAALPKVRPAIPRPRPAPEAAYAAALRFAPPRERLMLRLAAEAGMRRAEVAQVHTRDVVEDLTGYSLVVHGKGGKERIVPLTASLAAELRLFAPRGYVFPGDDGGHLSPRWVGKLVAGRLPDGHTMHALRHRFATRVYEVDRDVFAVQELLGHASPDTTRRYVAVQRDHLRASVEAIA